MSKSKACFGAVSAALVAGFLLVSCGEGFSPLTSSGGGSAPSKSEDGSSSNPGGGDKTAPVGICSKLSLTGVTWPSSLAVNERTYLALALNISGSFEGGQGWANLTNNFDGQGLSMGLLNQNFGQGSLQPLWIKMRDRYPTTMRSLFTAAHLTNINSMLARYQQVTGQSLTEHDVEAMSEEDPNSPLDVEYQASASGDLQEMSANSDGVNWAKATLYTDRGTTFHATWKNELKAMGANPGYVSIQIEKSLALHTKAMRYLVTLSLKELRSYLMLFDVNVQNGGLYQADIDEYKAYFATRASSSETTRLTKLLELRLRHVVPRYLNDVRSRKLALINGTGLVHGSNRNFKREYCVADDRIAVR